MGNFKATQQDNLCLLKITKSTLCFSQPILNNKKIKGLINNNQKIKYNEQATHFNCTIIL